MELKESLKFITASIDSSAAKNAITTCAFFEGFTKAEIDILATHAESKKFSRNAPVFNCNFEGSDDQKGRRYFYIIQSGSLQLRLKSGKIKKLAPYDTFGEISVLTEYGRTGTIIATEDCHLVGLAKSNIFDPEKIPLELALKITRKMARKMVGYLAEGDNQPVGAAYLIAQGESKKVEFKESFTDANKVKIYQTIGAFFNAEGGTVLIGVQDDKKIIGINEDLLYTDIDKLKNSITSTIYNRYGKSFVLDIDIDFEEIDDKLILRIDCYQTKKPAFYIEGGKDSIHRYFVRAEAANIELKGMELYQYLKKLGI